MKELRDIGIFGMLVPKKYGGLDFNTHARSQIVQKFQVKMVLLVLFLWCLTH